MPYREPARPDEELTWRQAFALLACRLFGHRWRILGVNLIRNLRKVHQHPMAGVHATCDRCGFEWDDRNPQEDIP